MSKTYFENLNIGGIKNNLVILDIDGTIACDQEINIKPEIVEKINKLKVNNKVIIFSNYRKSKRNIDIAKELDLELVESSRKKPSKKILKDIENKNNYEIIVIGDKFLTDELFAHNIKASFIKVKRLTCKKDRFLIKISYALDDFCSAFKNLIKRLV